MTAAVDTQKPTRTELSLERIGRTWSVLSDGPAATRALVSFLRSLRSSETLRAYSYSILEMFSWLEAKTGTIPTPSRIGREDAAAFAAYLRHRDHGLTRKRLEEDPERRRDVAIVSLLERRQGITAEEIARVLGRPEEQVATRLKCLVRVKTIERRPSLSDIRSGRVQISGWTEEMQSQAAIGYAVPESVFRYYPASLPTSPGPERASGMTARLTALHSFWQYLREPTETQPPLVTTNPWTKPLKEARQVASSHQAVSRAEKTPDEPIFQRLLATTYVRQLGAKGALKAAAYAMRGQYVRTDPRSSRLTDLRDRALLLFMLQTGGPRASEIGRVRRSDVSVDPPIVTIRGKRGKVRQLKIPTATAAAIGQLDEKLRLLAKVQARYGRTRAIDQLGRNAPLFPAVRHWGQNSQIDATKGLGRPAIAMMLRRRAVEAGIERGTAEFKKIHPHGLRHLFAQMAKESTPLTKIQAMMGHASLSTTGRYLEERKPAELVAVPFEPPTAPAPSEAPEEPPEAPAAAPAPPKPVRLETPPKGAERRPEPKEEAAEPEKPKGLVQIGKTVIPEADEKQVAYWRRRLGRALTRGQLEMLNACATAGDEVAVRLCQIYELDWGEKGSRKRIQAKATAVETAFEAAFAGIDVEVATATEKLEHAYRGSGSGFVWWDGPAGKLSLSLPVASDRQIGSCQPGQRSELCQALTELYLAWSRDVDHYGPTAASALVEWIVTALSVSYAVEPTASAWLPYESPWEQTAQTSFYREHDVDRITTWFEQVASSHRFSRGRSAAERASRQAKTVGEAFEPPAWYSELDPIGSLPASERAELLDLMRALTTGEGLRDDRRRYGRTGSRRSLGELLGRMKAYDELYDERSDLRVSGDEEGAARLTARMGDLARAIDQTAAALGKTDYDYAAQVTARRRARKAGAKRLRRKTFYLEQIGAIAGGGWEADPLLARLADPGGPPLSVHAELLKPDPTTATIRHTQDFKRRFAAQTGQHSECVARRMARRLWELWRSYHRFEDAVATLASETDLPVAASRAWLQGKQRYRYEGETRELSPIRRETLERAAERHGIERAGAEEGSMAFRRDVDLEDLAFALLSTKVACPPAQEYELRQLLRQAPELPSAVQLAWERGAEPSERVPDEEIATLFSELQTAFEPEVTAATVREMRQNPTPPLLPTPVEVLFAL